MTILDYVNKQKIPFFTRDSESLAKDTVRDHPYITSAKGLGGWGQKNCNFADDQYYFY